MLWHNIYGFEEIDKGKPAERLGRKARSLDVNVLVVRLPKLSDLATGCYWFITSTSSESGTDVSGSSVPFAF